MTNPDGKHAPSLSVCSYPSPCHSHTQTSCRISSNPGEEVLTVSPGTINP